MDTRTRHTTLMRLRTPALVLAVTALCLLVVAGPAVAKPGHVPPSPGATLSAAGTLTAVAVAACVTIALVLLAVVAGRRTRTAARPAVGRATYTRRDDQGRLAA